MFGVSGGLCSIYRKKQSEVKLPMGSGWTHSKKKGQVLESFFLTLLLKIKGAVFCICFKLLSTYYIKKSNTYGECP